MRFKNIKILLFFVALFWSVEFVSAATVVCDTTSALTIPGAQNPYSMNFNCAVPSGATASLEINWTAVGDRDGRDYFTCGGSTLYTTSAITAPLPKLMTTDVSTCLRGYTLTSGNRICTNNAWSGSCGGYYYGLAAGHSTMEYARLTVTYTDGPPLVNTLSPADNNTTFNMVNDLVISFDRATYIGSGNIVIKKGSDNSIVETIDVTSGQVTGGGTPTITINPSVDLVKNTAYYVQIDATAFNDNNGNNYAGISNTTSWNFTTLNIIPPTTQATNLTFSSVTSSTLTLSWTNGNGGGRMVFAKQANTGTAAPVEYTNYTASSSFGSGSQIGSSGWYAIYSGTGTSIAVTNLSAQTNYIFHVVEYNTVSNAKNYFIDASSNNPSVAFITSAVYETTSALTIPGAQNSYSMNFNGGVPAGATASLEINWTAVGDRDGRDYFTCGGSTLYTTSAITAPLPKLMTTDVSTCLRGYNLATGNRLCTNNAWSGSCGGYYYGLAAGHSTMEYARLTVTFAQGSPVVTSFSPADNNATASASTNLVIYFDRSTYVGTGNITIKKGSDNSTVETIDVTSGQVTGSGTSIITIDPSVTLDSDTAYYVQIDATAFNDNNGNNYAGISNTTSWNFSTIDSTPPTVQANTLAFSSVTYNSLTLGWVNGNGDGRIVFAKQANTGTASPVDNTNYTASASFGSGTQIGSSGWYTIYKGTGTSVAVTGLTASTDYIFQVFEYDLAGSNPLFFTDTATANPAVQTTSVLTEPTTQATNVTFSSINPTQMTISWTSGNGNRRVVFAKQANTGTATPVDDTAYTANSTLGSGTQIGTSGWYAVYNSTGSSFTVYGLTANTDYIFQVFELNQSGAYYNFNANTGTNNPKSQTTQAAEPNIQATNVTFSSVLSNSFAVSWASGNGSNRVVFVKAASSGSATPVDLTAYTANTAFGSGTQIGSTGWYCVYNGSSNSVAVTGLSMNTAYRVQVFEYNGSTGLQNYFSNTATGNPANQTTTGNYTLTYTAGAGGTISGSSPQTVSPGGNGTEVSAVPNTGYLFSAWSDGILTAARTDTNVTSSKSVTANFTATTNTISYIAGTGGTITGSSTQIISYGSNATRVTSTPSTGYSFVSWSDGNTSTSRLDTNIITGASYTATFLINTYSLNYSAGAGGTLTGLSTQSVQYGGSGSVVTAVPNEGFSFYRWSDFSTSNPRTDTNIGGNLTVSAQFSGATNTLRYLAGSNGSISGSSTQIITFGENGTAVTATPDSGYYFVYWSDGSTANPRTDLNVVAGETVTAYFSLEGVIYANSSSGNDTTGNGSVQAPYKTFKKAYAMAVSGNIIDLTGTFTWTDSAEISGTSATNGFTIAKNITIQGHTPEQTIIQAAVADNTANRRVFTIAQGYTVTLKNLAVRYGKLSGSGYDGGGIRNDGTLTVQNCEIYNNRTLADGGGGISNRYILNITSSTLYNNQAMYMGGGVLNNYYIRTGGSLKLTNSTIVNNQVSAISGYSYGGGVHVRSGSATITNSTIAFNSACWISGVGMDSASSTLAIKNTIIAKNIQINASSCNNGLYPVDFGLYYTGYGTVTDNGNNIIGFSRYYTWVTNTDWTDAVSTANIQTNRDGIYKLYGASTTGTIGLVSNLSLNNNSNKVRTLALQIGSIAIDNGGVSANGSVSVPVNDQRGVARDGSTDIGAFEYADLQADITPPVISNIVSTPSSNSAIVTWTTNELSSSQMKYDPNTYRSTETQIYNSSVMVTSHSVTLSNLVACTKYYYSVASRDSSGNFAFNEDNYFYTTGCTGGSTISEISEVSFDPATTTIVNHMVGDKTFAFTIPSTFSENYADFQIKNLSATEVFRTVPKPTSYNPIGDKVMDIKAFADPETTITTTSASVVMSMTYTDSDVVGIDPTTLKIYSSDGSSDWVALDNCVVDTAAKTVTCDTAHFSVFGLFGQSSGSSESNNTSSGGGGFVPPSKPIINIVPIISGNKIVFDVSNVYQMAISKRADFSGDNWQEYQNNFTNDSSSPLYIKFRGKDGGESAVFTVVGETTKKIDPKISALISKYYFKRDLKLKMSGNDVKELQKFLNNNGFIIDTAGIGSQGKESVYFGSLTQKALIKFQKVNKISPAVGYFGSVTRGVVNK